MTNNGPVKIYYRKNVLLIALMLLLFLFLCLKQSLGQDSKPTEPTLKNSVSLCFSLFGPEYVGSYINYYLSNRVSVNGGLGFNLDFHVGMNYYFSKRETRGSSFYLGLQATRYRRYDILNFLNLTKTEPLTQLGLYLPIGFEYAGRKGIVFQFEAGPNFVSDQWYGNDNRLGYNTFPVMISFKIGGIIN